MTNSILPKLRFKKFKDEWKLNKIGNLSNVTTGGTPSTLKKEYWGGNIRWMNSGELNLKIVNEVANRITEKGLENSSTKLIPRRCILIGLAGQGKTRGTAAMNFVELCVNQSIAAVYPNPAKFVPEYLYQNINFRYEELRNLSTGDGGRGGLNLQIIKSFKVPLPSLPEQQKIASFLSAVDEKVQQLTRKRELLEQYKKGVMQQLFSGKLRFKNENGKAFSKWEWVNGNIIFDSVSNKNHSSDLPILAITQEQGAIPREMINYQMSVTASSVASYKVVEIGDFIISLRTFQGGIEYSNYTGICSPAYNILRPSSKMVDRGFYKYYLKTPRYIKQLQKNLEGIREGKMISYKYFSEIKLPFPCKNEQIKIANLLSEVDLKVAIVSNKISQTQTFKKGLLQQMFV